MKTERLNTVVINMLTLCCVSNAIVGHAAGAETRYPQNVYWGDTHLHTSLSADIYTNKGPRFGPDEAYRFAKGETIVARNGLKVRLRRPLDFLVVADHAENLGVVPALEKGAPELLKNEDARRLYKKILKQSEMEQIDPIKAKALWRTIKQETHTYADEFANAAFKKSVWGRVTANADRYNDPGVFTAFIGYEWTEKTANLHRVVVFEDNANKANQVIPFSRSDSDNPEDLWAFLNDYETTTDGRVLAIPHNSNLTGGKMFALETSSGAALTRDYAERRSRWEPLMEATQNKGDSETHPFLSPNDEFADHETFDIAAYLKKKNGAWLEGSYARSGLKRGLSEHARLGVNPFKFGMIGSTDSHSALSTADENGYWRSGQIKAPFYYLAPGRTEDELAASLPNYIDISNLTQAEIAQKALEHHKTMARFKSMAGYAAVWAQENTREALFAAMKRKEVYATTGPRMTVRLFGGWDYEKTDADRPDLARIGYDGGVPMGGDLTHAPKGKAPKFLIRAVKDPDGANLDRVQVIKGWQDKNGELQEKVYNVALSDGRKDKGNKTRKVGSTVNIKDAAYTNTIGDPELAVVWEDPDFDADQLAFYYVRVLEIPTPRWTAYDAKFFNIPRNKIPDEVPMVIQERAYTSPIWYSPR